MSEHTPDRNRREPDATDSTGDVQPNSDPFGPSEAGGVTRRRVLKVLAAGAGAAAIPSTGCVDGSVPDTDSGVGNDAALPGATVGGNPLAAGTPTDPDMVTPVVWWDLVLTDDERATLAVLCDVILPADDRSPSASAVGAHDFIDEWVSAPYDGNRNDLVMIRGGLVWLDVESNDRFSAPFRSLSTERHHAICDDICYQETAAPRFRAAARFFDRVRDLTSTAFWTTDEGMADLGFVGNRPMPTFEGPPPEVLEALGLS